MGDLVDRMDIDNVTDAANVVFAMNLTTDNVQAHLSATDLCGEESADDTDEQQNTLIDAPKKFRLEQLEVFKSLILEKAADIDKQQESKRQGRAVNIDNGITIGQLMEEQGKATLNNPREYQLELYERAKKENTIAVLETGSGKTLIAVLLIRYILDQELEDRAKGVLPRTTFFMVSSLMCTKLKVNIIDRFHRTL
jgi:endoribonuclease Dicer